MKIELMHNVLKCFFFYLSNNVLYFYNLTLIYSDMKFRATLKLNGSSMSKFYNIKKKKITVPFLNHNPLKL